MLEIKIKEADNLWLVVRVQHKEKLILKICHWYDSDQICNYSIIVPVAMQVNWTGYM